MTHIDLFSGIGGFSVAANWAGFKTVVFCEIDPFCQKVLHKHWGGVEIESDIRNLDGTKYRGVTLLTGGFPCQPFSVAGKRKGKDDDRFLWPEMFRVIKEARPRWIVAENVPGIVNMALGQVLSDLESEGYDFPRDLAGNIIVPIIPAVGKNAPHKRDRCWIIAHSVNGRPQERWGENSEQVAGSSEDRQTSGFISAEVEKSNSDVTDSEGKRLQGCKRTNGGKGSQPNDKQFDRCGGEHTDRWQENWYEVATRLCTLDDGLPRGLVRPKGWRVNALKAAGNAIVPQVAYEILKGIAKLEVL